MKKINWSIMVIYSILLFILFPKIVLIGKNISLLNGWWDAYKNGTWIYFVEPGPAITMFTIGFTNLALMAVLRDKKEFKKNKFFRYSEYLLIFALISATIKILLVFAGELEKQFSHIALTFYTFAVVLFLLSYFQMLRTKK